MTFVDRLEAKSAAQLPGPDCGVNRLLQAIPATARDDVLDAIARTRTIRTSVLAQAIEDEFGIYVSQQTLGRHRNRQCRCARTS